MEIEKLRVNYDRPRDAKKTTTNEVLAFTGILILAGVKKQNHTNFLELWTTGSEIFRSCMNCNRFLGWSAIRFDDKNTRKERQLTDKLAAIRFTLDRFVENCKNNYSLGEYGTIEEMLIPFRGRCSFIQNIPNKSAKYGLKVFVLFDSKTFYARFANDSSTEKSYLTLPSRPPASVVTPLNDGTIRFRIQH
ncbi:DDE_Tnp_1_7 domain-containing protein [Trichonephila clavata]|uniref:DDE_Tnp_1_7 domain-containing protein n=1 Tax=Trichonephila clavata TaxID=2740835 RepID=A0A8X6IJB1_TRICU|nr:DDE_Tnp_1_7 domain-containing protein [Trichonephila clavata]